MDATPKNGLGSHDLDFCPAVSVWNRFGILCSETPHDESKEGNFLQDALPNSEEQQTHLLNTEATHKNGFGSQTPHDESIKYNLMEDALSNSVVLRHIFTFLDEDDLESCCHVCQDWRTVADPLVVPHFGIKLARTNYARNGRIVGSHVSAQLADSEHYITVREGVRYNRKSFTQRKDLGVAQILKVILTQKVSISLTLSEYIHIQGDEVIDFLSKIGPAVLNLDLHGVETSRLVLCKLLVQKFPNLKKLNCCGFRTSEDYLEDRLFDPDLPQNKHKRLRKIVFGDNRFTYLFVETMLKMCENLEKIEDFPLPFINAVVVARKGPLLKSLLSLHKGYYSDADFCETGETVVTAYEKLAGLEPKLTSLEFCSGSFQTENEFELVKPLLFSVLQSRHESLELLQIAPLRYKEVQHLPTLKRLKELDLLFQYNQHGQVYFAPKMRLKEIFPNVCKLGSSTNIWDEAFIERYLREKFICPWGTQIIELSVNELAVSAIPLLQRRFPSIQKLEIKNSLLDLPKILLELSRFWPQLKSLTISFDYNCNLRRLNLWKKKNTAFRLDHFFTGLPEKVIDQLEDRSRSKKFTDKEIQELKDGSIIHKFKELRELKILLREYNQDYEYGYSTYGVAYTQLTTMANEFGFSLLPELRVTLAVEPLEHFAKEMEEGLQPLATCSNIEIVSALDGYPYVFNNYR